MEQTIFRIFRIPSGKIGKLFVREIVFLFKGYNEAAGLESIALRAAMVMPALLLQKCNPRMKTSEVKKCLERRIEMWKKGQIDELVNEGKVLQQRAVNLSRKDDDEVARRFANLVFHGKMKEALRLLSSTSTRGCLSPDLVLPENDNRTVFEELSRKHPKGRNIDPSALLPENDHTVSFHPVIFESLDGLQIRNTISKMKGSAGPSGLDTDDWRQMCCSFKDASNDLCNVLADTAKYIATSYVDPVGLEALNACRLVALEKTHGVRPIGIGEVVKRMLAKVILKIVKEDIQQVIGPLQMCAGYENGVEVASLAMQTVFEADDTEAVILVDAENAFNSMNRKLALANILHSCPSIATVLINTYRSQPKLFIQGRTLISDEGTTQGDPLAMAMYALAIAPLIKKCATDAIQVWYADDASAGGTVNEIFSWWGMLVDHGPKFGYFPKACKSSVIVKKEFEAKALEVFNGTGLNITSEGKTHLGIPLGSTQYKNRCISEKVQQWCEQVDKLSLFARSQPHAAFATFSHGVISGWMFYMRMIPLTCNQLTPLEHII